jgi:hypothetical protein
MKETLESVAIMIGIIVVAEVINEVAGYKLVQVDFSKPKKRT